MALAKKINTRNRPGWDQGNSVFFPLVEKRRIQGNLQPGETLAGFIRTACSLLCDTREFKKNGSRGCGTGK